MTTSTATRPDGPWFIADERALDFINTLAMAEHSPHDFLQSDEDVLLWLNHVGFAAAAVGKPGELLAAARALRSTIRELVTAKKRGETLALNALNTWLAQAQSYLQISDDGGEILRVERKYLLTTPQQVLAPIVENAAYLLAEGEFAYVRQCEHPECTLWFYDKTKAHRRRWCSMALCGNRAKVARFRAKS